MRTSPHPPISSHRRARLTAWARLWWVWFVGYCAALYLSGRRVDRRTLDRVARGVRALVIMTAAPRAPKPIAATHRHGRLGRFTFRKLAGGRMRRAMRGRNWVERVFAMLAAMRDLDAHADAMLKRIPHGLTRQRRMTGILRVVPLTSAPQRGAACADTS